MASTNYVISNPCLSVVKSTSVSTLILLTASFTTGVVSSSVLSSTQTALLTSRLQILLAALPVKAAAETGFVGMVRSLLALFQFEPGDFTADMTYSSPTATLTLNNLETTSHVAVTIPFSTSASVIGDP